GLAAATASAATTPVGEVTEFVADADAGFRPGNITSGPDGNLWFTLSKRTLFVPDAVVRMTPQGQATTFTLPGGNSGVRDITSGPLGSLWVTEVNAGRIMQVTTTGDFPMGSGGIPVPSPSAITAGPDGNLWFGQGIDTTDGTMNRTTPQGQISSWTTGLPTSPELPIETIARGVDGAVWFTPGEGPPAIGRITTGGQLTVFRQGITAGAGMHGITAGPDGAMWFTEFEGGRIGRITPEGAVTEFSAGITAGSKPTNIVLGPDGNLWFTQSGANAIGRITPQGVVTNFRAGANDVTGTSGIAVGSDGNIWFTEANTNRVGRMLSGARPAVTVTKAGTGSGTVSSAPAGIDCGATCSAAFDYGQAVTLTATPAAGSTFAGWGGACSGTGACTVTTTQARAVTATFAGPPAPAPVVKPKNLAGTFHLNKKTRVGTTTGAVPPGATAVVQTIGSGGGITGGVTSIATEGFVEMAKATKGTCRITTVRNKKTKKVTRRTYSCTAHLRKGTWTITTTARGKAGVVAEGTRRVVVR
ncbi:MAG: hypothetical protein KGQ95_09450, partial [Acidobacteria bacterium]|nr:hypothetical protein [Acidobacteriota bacterium]